MERYINNDIAADSAAITPETEVRVTHQPLDANRSRDRVGHRTCIGSRRPSYGHVVGPRSEQITPMTTGTTSQATADAQRRDGQHDFDSLLGTWDVKLRRLLRPLTGADEWIEYEGTSECRPVWDGRANVDEFRVHSPATGARIDGLTLRLYNAETGEWSLYWANANNGALSLPPTVGRFTDAS